MSSNITPSTSDFGTENLNGDTGDVFPSDVWTRIGGNTGFLQHDPHMWWSIEVPNDADVFPADITGYSYLVRGTYTVYTGIYLAAGAGAGTVSLNGTILSATDASHNETDTGFVVSTDSWGTFLFDLSGAAGDTSVCVRARRESY